MGDWCELAATDKKEITSAEIWLTMSRICTGQLQKKKSIIFLDGEVFFYLTRP